MLGSILVVSGSCAAFCWLVKQSQFQRLQQMRSAEVLRAPTSSDSDYAVISGCVVPLETPDTLNGHEVVTARHKVFEHASVYSQSRRRWEDQRNEISRNDARIPYAVQERDSGHQYRVTEASRAEEPSLDVIHAEIEPSSALAHVAGAVTGHQTKFLERVTEILPVGCMLTVAGAIRDGNTIGPSAVGPYIISRETWPALLAAQHGTVEGWSTAVSLFTLTTLLLAALYIYRKRRPSPPSRPPHRSPSSFPPDIPITANDDASHTCSVCMEHRIAVLFSPCGHVCCCASCAHRCSLCPICRAPVESLQRAFLAS